MQKIRELLSFYWLPILAGILLSTSFIPFPPWALFFGYAPLWFFWFTRAKNWKQIFWGGWTTQFVFSLIGFHWIAYTAHEFGQIPWVLAVAVLCLFAALVHLYVPLSGVVWWYSKKYFHPAASLAVLVICALSAEYLWPSLFAWNMGLPWLSARLPAMHIADLIGFDGLSAITFAINGWILWIWMERRSRKKLLIHALALAKFMIALQLLGSWRLHVLQKPDSEVSVLQVQANIGNADKLEAEKGVDHYQKEIIERFLTLTKKGLTQFPNSQLIVWPETAFPDFLNAHYKLNEEPQMLYKFLQQEKKILLTGAYSKDPPRAGLKNEDRQIYNGIFLLGENGEYLVEPYHKTILLAYGEYYPLTEQFPILQKWFGVSNFGRGPGPTVFSIQIGDQRVNMGVQICYEGIYPSFSRGLSNRGANMLANVTNDSWFGKDAEPFQNMYLTFGRAIETRLPFIRNTNTGISSVMLADGTLMEQSPIHEEWVGQYKIPYVQNPKQTFYVRYGYLWPIFIVLALLALYMIGPKGYGRRKD